MPNIPAIVYFGCAGVAIGSLGLALQVPSYLPKRHAVPQVETASASQPRVISTARPQNEAKDAEKAWPPTNGAVSFHDEMTALLNFESSTAVKSAHEDYAKALPAEQPPAAELPQETARAPAPE